MIVTVKLHALQFVKLYFYVPLNFVYYDILTLIPTKCDAGNAK